MDACGLWWCCVVMIGFLVAVWSVVVTVVVL